MSRTRARGAELGLLALLVVVGVAPLVAMLAHAAGPDRVFAGADGPFPGDQFQYFSWIRDHARGLLVDNDLDPSASGEVFFHPMFALSGLLVRLGLSVELAYLLWKPVAAVALFAGCRAYAARFLERPAERAAALALALLAASPLVVVIGTELVGATGEMYSAGLLWGYLPAAISVALMPLFLLGVERVAARPARARELAAVCACGAAASWLHPWQGQVLLVTLVAALVLRPRRDRRLGPVVLAGAATLAPLLYYFVLSLADPAWELAAKANEEVGVLPLWTVLLALVPIGAAAALGVRRAPADLGEAMLLAWAPATVLVFAFLSPSVPQHALEGIAIPLGVLAVRGLARLRRPALTAAALALLVVPGGLFMADWLEDTVRAPGQAHYLAPGERAALDHLRATGGGTVLSSPRLGALIPSATGLRPWVGHPSWTHDFARRAREADALLQGTLGRERADRLLRDSGARFVLVDCRSSADGLAALGPLVAEEAAFGCASVHRVVAGAAVR